MDAWARRALNRSWILTASGLQLSRQLQRHFPVGMTVNVWDISHRCVFQCARDTEDIQEEIPETHSRLFYVPMEKTL